MHLLFNRLMSGLLMKELYAPADSVGSGGATGEGLDTFELLNVEEPAEVLELPTTGPKTNESVKEKEDEGEETEEEEIDELKEIEEELEGPSDEDLELTTPVRRREILKKYPQLFKDFPYLEKAYYREQQFTEVYPTIQDAKQASEKASILDSVEKEILNGDITTVLKVAKKEDNEAFLKIADNYLPTLRKVDQQAYYHVLGNVIKDTIITMVREGRALGDQGAPLQQAANILNQFVFGSQTFQPPQPLSKNTRPEDADRQAEVQREEHQRTMSHFESTRDDLQSRADNVLKSTIDQHIDPKKSMTDYVRKNATREAFETLEGLISKDTRFRGLLDKLWERAFEKKFDKESTDKIKAAYLSKAKTLLPSVIKRARNDALKGLGKRVQDDDSEDIVPEKKGPVTAGRPQTQSSGKIKSSKDIPKGMSTLDVLMQD